MKELTPLAAIQVPEPMPEQVYAASLEVLQQAGDHPLILSLGGAVTIGMPPANVRAMIRAVADFNRTKTAG